jgi:predicted dehydrogenase
VHLAPKPARIVQKGQAMSTPQRVGIGLAGLGRMGRIHARNLTGYCTEARLSCVYDVSAEAAWQASEQFGVPRAGSYDELLAHPGTDAVVVATPTGTHAELTRAAAQAGQDVFCEKPLASSRADTVATIEAVARGGVLLQVGFHRRYDPDWAAVAARIQAGELGEVRFFRSSGRDMTSPPLSFLAGSGGIFRDVTIHDLDGACWLAGDIAEISAHGAAQADPEGLAAIGDVDSAVVVLRFASGALGVIDNSRACGYGYECSAEIVGTRATARIGAAALRGHEWRTPGAVGQDLVTSQEERQRPAYAAELDGFARRVRDRSAPEPSGAAALAAFDLAEAAAQAWRSGQTVAVRAVAGGGYAFDREEAVSGAEGPA